MLLLLLTLGHCLGEFKKTVRESGLAVVDVGNDGKVSCELDGHISDAGWVRTAATMPASSRKCVDERESKFARFYSKKCHISAKRRRISELLHSRRLSGYVSSLEVSRWKQQGNLLTYVECWLMPSWGLALPLVLC